MATKIRSKQESGLTAVWLKRDPPVPHKDSFTCNLLISCSASAEVSHTFQYRRYMSSWSLSNLCILLCIVFVVTFSCCCCYCVMLFISNCGCTIRDKKQQHHYEIVTTMTTAQSNLHRLISVQELILWGDTMQFYMGKNTDIPPTNQPHM